MGNIGILSINMLFILLFIYKLFNANNSAIVNSSGFLKKNAIVEKNQEKGLKNVLTLPISKGYQLEVVRDDNWEYPKDFQVKGGIMYILSGEEKKIVAYDTQKSTFLNFDTLNFELKRHLSSVPIFLRITNDYYFICFDFEVMVFSKSQQYLTSQTYTNAINYLTNIEDTLFVWNTTSVDMLLLNGGKMKHLQTVSYSKSDAVDFSDIVIQSHGKLVTPSGSHFISNKSLLSFPNYFYPQKYIPEYELENFSLCSVTEKYSIWYPWKSGSKLIFLDCKDGTGFIKELGVDITMDCLSYAEDPENGLKVQYDEGKLYFMVMKNIQKNKALLFYEFKEF